MFFLTNIDIGRNMARVYDTNDGTNDVIRLNALLAEISAGRLCVEGIGTNCTCQDTIRIPGTYFCASVMYARESLARWMITYRGVDKYTAYKSVGLA